MSPQVNAELTPQEFAHLGVSVIAYVKRVLVDDELLYAVHAADGTPIGLMRDRDAVFATLRDHDLEPLSVH